MENQHRLIKGYRDLSQEEIDLMNEVKEQGALLNNLIHRISTLPGIDQRWLDIGTTDLQTGIMAVTRAIAKPTSF